MKREKKNNVGWDSGSSLASLLRVWTDSGGFPASRCQCRT